MTRLFFARKKRDEDKTGAEGFPGKKTEHVRSFLMIVKFLRLLLFLKSNFAGLKHPVVKIATVGPDNGYKTVQSTTAYSILVVSLRGSGIQLLRVISARTLDFWKGVDETAVFRSSLFFCQLVTIGNAALLIVPMTAVISLVLLYG